MGSINLSRRVRGYGREKVESNQVGAQHVEHYVNAAATDTTGEENARSVSAVASAVAADGGVLLAEEQPSSDAGREVWWR